MQKDPPRRRLAIELTEAEHEAVFERARKLKLSMSNFIRRTLGLPEQKWGVRRQK